MVGITGSNSDMARFGTQSRACTALAASARAQLGKLFANGAGVGLLPASFEIRQYAFKLALTVEHRFVAAWAERFPGLIKAKSERSRQGLQGAKGRGVASVPACDCARGKTQIGKLHHAQRVEVALDAKPVAAWTGTCRVVK